MNLTEGVSKEEGTRCRHERRQAELTAVTPPVCELFKEIDLTEKQGTGITKILRELRKNGSPDPEFEMDEDRTYLETTIYMRDGVDYKIMSKSMSESMSELEQARMKVILEYLKTHSDISGSIASNGQAVVRTNLQKSLTDKVYKCRLKEKSLYL